MELRIERQWRKFGSHVIEDLEHYPKISMGKPHTAPKVASRNMANLETTLDRHLR